MALPSSQKAFGQITNTLLLNPGSEGPSEGCRNGANPASARVVFSGFAQLLSSPVHADVHLLARIFPTAFEIDTLLLFEGLVHHGGLLAGDVLDHHRAHERLAGLGELDEAREFPGGH